MHTSDNTQAGEITSLEKLATELAALGYSAKVATPIGGPAYLDVRNPRASVLSEKVFARAGSYFWPWSEPIAGCDEACEAAAMVARVLRAVDEQ